MGDKSGVRIGSESSIEIDFYFRGIRCRERIKLEPNDRNLKYCERLKGRIEDEVFKNQFEYAKHFPDSPKLRLFARMPGDTLLIEHYVQSWLEEERQNVRHSTWQGYKQVVSCYIIPAFGKIALSELKRRHIKDWMATKADISPKTLGNILSPLRIALDDAVEDDLIELSPLAGWRIKRLRKAQARRGRRDGSLGEELKDSRGRVRKLRYKVDPFSIEEQMAIISAAAGQNRNMIQFAFWSGLRTSEICGLDWSDIDWIRGVVRVRFVLTRGLTEPEEDTKTDAGEREVKLLPAGLEALQAQKAFTFLKDREVFQNPKTGERWMGPNPIGLMWSSTLRKTNVRYRNQYQTRHTYASTLLMAGELPQWVANQMGHTDWTFTARTYSRWIPDNAPDAGRKAAAMWSNFGQRAAANT
jgi:integrase